MKILWITNIKLPPICKEMGMPLAASGGWMVASALKLSQREGVELAVATVYGGEELIDKTIDGVRYFLLPLHGKSNIKYNPSLRQYWREVYDRFNLDVTHLHGTEYAHGLAYLDECGSDNVVVSIQGLVSVIARYYLAGMSRWDVIKNITFRDLLLGTIFADQKSFFKRGKTEREIISRVGYVIGRTSWDKAHALAINPNVNYMFCNETLRSSFYHHKWDYSKCEPHSIFISQASYPIKGLHQVLKAMPLVLAKYPNAKIYVAGADPTSRPFYLRTGYGQYLKRLIKQYGLEDNVYFTGSLSEEAMCDRYLKSHVFVCPSSIENSPNSLGEAQLLGMPCVASYVGGSPDMMRGREEYLYRFEEIEMLAEKIMKAFEVRVWRDNSGAMERHSAEVNDDMLFEIYCKFYFKNK